GMCGLHDFFFSSRRRHTRLVSDWSSDVCSSDLTHPYSAGALVSTVDDLARWQAALDKDGLLSSESRKRMWTPVTLPDGTPTRYRSEERRVGKEGSGGAWARGRAGNRGRERPDSA